MTAFSCLLNTNFHNFIMLREKVMCVLCGEDSKFTCGRCQRMAYCAKGCQVKHWKLYHKKYCGRAEFARFENVLMVGPPEKLKKLLTESPELEQIYAEETGSSIVAFVMMYSQCKVPHLRVLLDAKVDFERPNPRGETATFYVVAEGVSDCLPFFFEAKCDFRWRNKHGLTPVHIAVINKRVNVLRLLHDAGVNFNVLDNENNSAVHMASIHGDVDVCKILLESNADVMGRNDKGWTPAFMATFYGNVGILKLFRERIDIMHRIRNGSTVLHLAVEQFQFEVLAYLIELKVDLNVMDDLGNTPAIVAVHSSNLRALKMLRAAKARLDVPNLNGEAPVHFASFYGEVGAMEELLDAGVEFNKLDADGCTPLVLAKTQGHEVIAALLESRRKCSSDQKECGNCTSPDGPFYACSRCKLVLYCGIACQKQHWKSHQGRCVAVGKRGVWKMERVNGDRCVICLDALSASATRRLLCGHVLHASCAKELTEGTSRCPVCRSP